MSVYEKAKEALGADPRPKLEGYVEERLKRGEDRIKAEKATRELCARFRRGDQYWFTYKGQLYDHNQQRVQANRGNDWEVYQTRDMISPIIDAKVSAATQQIPGYDVTASTNDPEDIAGARLSQKIALAGYEQWGLRKASEKAVDLSLTCDEAYALAFFDTSIGPYVEMEGEPDPLTGEMATEVMALGDVRVRIFSGQQVGYEPGVDFEEARWFYIEHARPIEDVKNHPDYLGGGLEGDVDPPRGHTKNTTLVMVCEYFERPCPKYPEGRHLTYANQKLIFPEEPYPLRDAEGQVVDEPCLRHLYYAADPDRPDQPRGLVRGMLDAQRTVNDVENKAIMHKNLSMVPQFYGLAEALAGITPTDKPGAVYKLNAPPGTPLNQVVQKVDFPGIPEGLFTIGDRARQDLETIALAHSLPPSEIESGKEAQAFLEQQQIAWGRFTLNLAEWHGKIMRDCLSLTQLHYSEPRLMQYRGRTGVEQVHDFRGTDLRKQTDVRVRPGSLVARTREQMRQEVQNIAQMFPGYFAPEVILSAMEGGNAEQLIQGYEEDVSRANTIIQKIKAGPEVLFSEPPRPVFPGEQFLDPATGQPGEEVPGWMPRPFDGVPIMIATFEAFMKTDDYDSLLPEMKQATNQIYGALLDLEAQKAAREQALQAQQAMELGAANAARPTMKPGPSLPAVQNGSQT